MLVTVSYLNHLSSGLFITSASVYLLDRNVASLFKTWRHCTSAVKLLMLWAIFTSSRHRLHQPTFDGIFLETNSSHISSESQTQLFKFILVRVCNNKNESHKSDTPDLFDRT